MEHIIIIGGGGTGAALAHDLTLRGFKVSLFERGELLSGATGRHHGLLHSGARYAVHDPVAACGNTVAPVNPHACAMIGSYDVTDIDVLRRE